MKFNLEKIYSDSVRLLNIINDFLEREQIRIPEGVPSSVVFQVIRTNFQLAKDNVERFIETYEGGREKAIIAAKKSQLPRFF